MYVHSTYPEITLKKEGFRKSYTTPLIKLGDTKPPKTCIIVGVREEDEPLTDVEDLSNDDTSSSTSDDTRHEQLDSDDTSSSTSDDVK